MLGSGGIAGLWSLNSKVGSDRVERLVAPAGFR